MSGLCLRLRPCLRLFLRLRLYLSPPPFFGHVLVCMYLWLLTVAMTPAITMSLAVEVSVAATTAVAQTVAVVRVDLKLFPMNWTRPKGKQSTFESASRARDTLVKKPTIKSGLQFNINPLCLNFQLS